jgi:hypothetical protein
MFDEARRMPWAHAQPQVGLPWSREAGEPGLTWDNAPYPPAPLLAGQPRYQYPCRGLDRWLCDPGFRAGVPLSSTHDNRSRRRPRSANHSKKVDSSPTPKG